MPDTKHTPGPWWIGDGTENSHYEGADAVLCKNDEGRSRVLFKHNPNFPKLFEANGRLIAAAPELLEAAQFALEIIETHLLELSDGSMAMRLRDAIKKAEAR